MNGQSSYGHIKAFDWWFPQIPGLKPRHILFYIGINDFYFPEGSKYDAMLRDSDTARHSPLFRIIKDRSALFYLLRTLTGMYLANVVYGIGHRRVDPETRTWVDVPEIEDHEDLMRTRLVSYEGRLEILIERVHKLGAIPIFVTQYSRTYKRHKDKVIGVTNFISFEGIKLNGVDQYYLMNILNKKTMEVCRKGGDVCADLANEIEFEDDDFYDPLHNSPKGAEKIGHYLYSKLRRSL